MYSVLIYTWKLKSWAESFNSVQMLGYNLYLAFLRNKEITVFYEDISNTNLPKCDFVIAIAYGSDKVDFENIKKKTCALKVGSFRQVKYDCDFNFVFNSDEMLDKTCILIPPPYNKSLLLNVEKQKKSVLVDHCWKSYLGTEKDLTFQIVDWLDDKDYFVSRMIRFDDDYDTLRKNVKFIWYTNYLAYLKITNDFENFVVTHCDSYPFGVIDMAMRGTRVLSPKGFLPVCMVKDFKINEFSNKSEFFDILASSVPNNDFSSVCIDYNEIVLLMNDKFVEWLG